MMPEDVTEWRHVKELNLSSYEGWFIIRDPGCELIMSKNSSGKWVVRIPGPYAPKKYACNFGNKILETGDTIMPGIGYRDYSLYHVDDILIPATPGN